MSTLLALSEAPAEEAGQVTGGEVRSRREVVA